MIKNFEDQRNFIMKIKKSFMKVVLLNELLNIHCLNQTLILKDFLIHFKLFNIQII